MILSYLGSKTSLLPHLEAIIGPLLDENTVFGDLFAGTGVVAQHFQGRVKRVIVSDLELYSYVICRALLKCKYDKISMQKNMATLNAACANINTNTNGSSIPSNDLVTRNFTPAGTTPKMFFTTENGRRIDLMRQNITRQYHEGIITYDEFTYLLASILSMSSKYANTSGTFRAFLKQFYPRSIKSAILSPIASMNTNANMEHTVVKQSDALDMAKRYKYDVVYLDPPYTSAQYSGYYSFLNYLCMYSHAAHLTGVGVLKDYNRSSFSSRKKAHLALMQLIKSLVVEGGSKYIFMSYSSTGLLSLSTIKKIMSPYGSITLYKIPYRKYSPNKIAASVPCYSDNPGNPGTKIRVYEYVFKLCVKIGGVLKSMYEYCTI